MAEGHDVVIYGLLAGVDAPEIASQKHEQDQPFDRKQSNI